MGLSTSAVARHRSPGKDSRRRDPVQERSQETVDRIQAAATRLLAQGTVPHSLTTAQIAAEAGLSVGALYRFFPDKQAIIDSIALAHLEAFQERLAAEFLADLPDTPATFVGTLVQAFAAYLTEHHDFQVLAYGTQTQPGRAISSALFEHQASTGGLQELMHEALGTLYGIEPDADFAFRLRIAAEIGDRLIGHALFQRDQELRQRVLNDARRILGPYLFPVNPDFGT